MLLLTFHLAEECLQPNEIGIRNIKYAHYWSLIPIGRPGGYTKYSHFCRN